MKDLVYYNGQETLASVKLIQTREPKMQRFMYLRNKVHGWLGVSSRAFGVSKAFTSDNGIRYYVSDTYLLHMSSNGKMFTTNSNHKGMSFDPITKDIKLWHNTKLKDIPWNFIEDILIAEDCEWVRDTVKSFGKGEIEDYGFESLRMMLSRKDLLKRVMKHKITNFEDLTRAFMKVDTRWRDLKLSHRASSIATLIKKNNHIVSIVDFLSIVLNAEATIDMMLQGKTLGNRYEDGSYVSDFPFFALQGTLMFDIKIELQILNKKINSMWSMNRLMQEHTANTRELMDLEISTLEDKDYEYATECPLAPGMELIHNSIRLYKEGREMEHCVYSYLSSATSRNVFHFHCTIGEKPFTLAVHKSAYGIDAYKVQQMFGKYNRETTPAQNRIINAWLEESVVQAWFDEEVRAHRDSYDNSRLINEELEW